MEAIEPAVLMGHCKPYSSRILAIVGFSTSALCAQPAHADEPAGSAAPENTGSLSVTATVTKPVDISVESDSSGRTVIVLRNVADVEVHAVGGTVAREGPDTRIVTPDGTGKLTLTLVY